MFGAAPIARILICEQLTSNQTKRKHSTYEHLLYLHLLVRIAWRQRCRMKTVRDFDLDERGRG